MTNKENKKHRYSLNGCCAQWLTFTVDNDGRVWDMNLEGGCPGMRTAIAALCNGRSINVLIKLLRGTTCRATGTSCPDAIARCFQRYLEKEN